MMNDIEFVDNFNKLKNSYPARYVMLENERPCLLRTPNLVPSARERFSGYCGALVLFLLEKGLGFDAVRIVTIPSCSPVYNSAIPVYQMRLGTPLYEMYKYTGREN